MRKSTALLAGMALSALVMIGLTVSAEQSSASFTATTTNPGNTFATATLTVSNDKVATTLVNLANVVPGDSANRIVTIQNTGNVGFTYATAFSTTTPTSVLWTDTTNGIQVSVTRGGSVIASGPISTVTIPVSGTVAATTGTDALTFDFSFPVGAGNTLQNKSLTFSIDYTATQLAGAAR